MRAEVPTGTVLAGFRVESPIGEGAMGTLYLAEAPDGQRVALKVLSPELARDERFRQRFLRESRLAASLDHPHIVPTVASGEENGLLFLAMAYVEGSDLRELLRREGRLEPERAIDLLAQVAEALDAAHAAGLVHRDVKPGNILVSQGQDGERAYVCDFGLARHVTSVSSLTGERGFVGTIDYVPPEQIEGGHVDRRADLYALGCVLYECLAGERPFDRDSELAVVFAHLNEPPPRLSEVRPELPEAFDGVFRTALAKSPADRFESCREFVAAARAAVHGRTFVRGRLRRRLVLGAAAAILICGAAIAGILATRGGADGGFRPGTLLLDLASGREIATISRSELPSPAFPLYSDGHFWVVNFDPLSFAQIDPTSGKIVRTIAAPAGFVEKQSYQPYAADGTTLWLGSGDDLVELDADRGRVVERLALDRIVGVRGLAEGVALGRGLVWVSRDAGKGQVVGVDPTTGKVRYRFDEVVHHDDIAYGDGLVWAADFAGVTVVDPRAGTVTNVQDVRHTSRFVAAGGGYGWAADTAKGVVYKLDRSGRVVDTYRTGLGANNMSFANGVLWVANEDEGTVSGIDAITGKQTIYRFGHPASLLAVGGDVLLVTLQPGPAVEDRIDALQGNVLELFSQQGEFGEGDEAALNWNPAAFQIEFATCAKLLNYPDRSGPAGLKLRPEIAAAMPTVSADGRTYTFRVRKGYRFSPPSNQPITAETFRYSIERALSPKLVSFAAVAQPGAAFVADIVGERDFREGKAAHISGLRASGDRLSITLERPSPDFLERLALPFFCPVPVGTPFRRGGMIRGRDPLTGGGAIPSPGPYFVAAYSNDKSLILRRNPNYHGPRPHALDAIALREGVDAAVAVDRIEHEGWDGIVSSGHNGSVPFHPLLSPNGILASRYGSVPSNRERYVPVPLPEIEFIALNSGRGPFAIRSVRRAAALAIDRAELAALGSVAPTDQLLPPMFPRFRERRLYALRTPRLARAAALMKGRGPSAVMAISRGCDDCLRQARALQAELRRIGIRVRLKSYEDPFAAAGKAGASIDMLFGRTRLDYPDSASFLRQMLLRHVPGGWLTAEVRREVGTLARLSGERRQVEAAALADRLAAADVPVVAWGNVVQGEFFSRSLGCRVFPPMSYGVALGALCLTKPSS